MDDETREVLTAQQVADILQINIYTVHALLREKRMKGFKVGTHWRISRKSLDTFMEITAKEVKNNE